MIRIVGVERNQDPLREFVLLQNQGMMRQMLRGHAVVPECSLDRFPATTLLHLFVDEVHIIPGGYVMLRTGEGEPKWTRTRDGSNVYNAFMQRQQSVWEQVAGPFHLLSIQHNYVERSTPALTLR